MSHARAAVFESRIESLELVARGKVRDIYAVDEDHLLIVATDRISAFDVILPDPVPGKGIVLTRISNFWFDKLKGIVRNHLTGTDPASVLATDAERSMVRDRSVVVRRMQPLPIEAVVRGYLIGSGWRDYCASGAVSGVELPPGLELAQQLREPIFTPSTKASVGAHDENISLASMRERVGADLTRDVESVSRALYHEAVAHARRAGIIIADTKFEFGIDPEGRLNLIDEVLTPDSSRFWPVESYRPGASPPSFDKQYVRDFLESLDWDKTPPGPSLPGIVLERTREKYAEALLKLTGETL